MEFVINGIGVEFFRFATLSSDGVRYRIKLRWANPLDPPSHLGVTPSKGEALALAAGGVEVAAL